MKNGRARFVGENKICLACPPKQYLEENKMENKALTKREAFEQIVKLQEQLLGDSNALSSLTDAIYSVCLEHIDMDGDARKEAIESVCSAFCRREQTIVTMIQTYEKIYNDLED